MNSEFGFQLCLLSRDAAKSLHTLYSLLKEEPKTGTLLWCSKSLIKTELDDIHIQTSNIILSFPHKLLFFFLLSPGLLQASMIALFHLQSKELEGQKVTAFAKISAGLFMCWVGKRKGWFNTRITGKNISMEASSTRAQTFSATVLCLLGGLQVEAGYLRIEPSIKNRWWKHRH